jgi:hypothetical protein
MTNLTHLGATMCEHENRLREAERRADLAVALALYTATIAARRPKKRTLGDRLWDLI